MVRPQARALLLDESAGPVIAAAAASYLTRAPACCAGNSVVFIDPKLNDPLFRSFTRYAVPAGYYSGGSGSAGPAAGSATLPAYNSAGSGSVGLGAGRYEVLKISENDLKVGQGKKAADRVCNALRANQSPTLFVWTPRYTPFDGNHRRNFMGMVKQFTALVEEQHPAPTQDRHAPPLPEIMHIHSKTFAAGIRVAHSTDAMKEGFKVHLLATRSINKSPL